MLISYIGDNDFVVVDGVVFKKGVPTDYSGKMEGKLSSHPDFKVEASSSVNYEFPTDSVEALDEWAKEHLKISIDKRKSLSKLIDEVAKLVSEKA